MSKSYARLMADAAFHARNARASIEEAQRRAPVEARGELDKAITVAARLQEFALRASRRGFAREPVRAESGDTR